MQFNCIRFIFNWKNDQPMNHPSYIWNSAIRRKISLSGFTASCHIHKILVSLIQLHTYTIFWWILCLQHVLHDFKISFCVSWIATSKFQFLMKGFTAKGKKIRICICFIKMEREIYANPHNYQTFSLQFNKLHRKFRRFQ